MGYFKPHAILVCQLHDRLLLTPESVRSVWSQLEPACPYLQHTRKSRKSFSPREFSIHLDCTSRHPHRTPGRHSTDTTRVVWYLAVEAWVRKGFQNSSRKDNTKRHFKTHLSSNHFHHHFRFSSTFEKWRSKLKQYKTIPQKASGTNEFRFRFDSCHL